METITKSFEFSEYEKCFAYYKEKRQIYGDAVALIISTHPYSSGYWVEKVGEKLTPLETAYIGEQADNLMQRVVDEIKLAKEEARCPQLIT